jgi:hypothetical protein
MPVVKVEDWDLAYDQWILVHKPNGVKQQDYAKSLGANATWLSTRFNEIARNRIMLEIKGDMPKVLQKALKGMEEGLNYVDPKEQASVSSRVFSTIADRDGMSPQAQIINIQQKNSMAVVSVPLFEEGAERAKAMFETEGDVYPGVIDEK